MLKPARRLSAFTMRNCCAIARAGNLANLVVFLLSTLLDGIHDFVERAADAILVVDDDPFVREVLARVLERRGWRCVRARDADDAERVFGDGREFVAAVTDLEMPGGDGVALAARLRARRPDLPIVLASGADLTRVPASAGFAALVGKEQGPAGIADAVERAIAERWCGERAH